MPGLLNGESRLSPKEIYERNKKGELSSMAIDKGLSYSRFLELEDPTDLYGEKEVLDAFGRQLKVAGIHTHSDPMNGIWADKFEVFDHEGNRPLALEWVARRVREVKFNQPANPRAMVVQNPTIQNRAVFTSVDEALNTVFRPWTDATDVRAPRRTLPLTLDRLVTITTPIEGDAYRAAYMTEPNADEIRFTRVTELGEIPMAHITQGEQTIRIYKYGRGMEISYEAVRRTRIDKVAFWVQRLALQNEVDKVEHAIDTYINGDGNGNGATVHAISTLGGSAGTLSFVGWLNFLETWGDAYRMDLAVMNAASKVELLMLDTGNGNNMAFLLAGLGLGDVNPINGRLSDTVDVARLSTMATDTILGIDTSAGLEHVTEVGANITETVDFITRQSHVMVMSEVDGFAILDEQSANILNVAG